MNNNLSLEDSECYPYIEDIFPIDYTANLVQYSSPSEPVPILILLQPDKIMLSNYPDRHTFCKLTLWPLLPDKYPCLIGEYYCAFNHLRVLGHCIQEGSGAGRKACLQQYYSNCAFQSC